MAAATAVSASISVSSASSSLNGTALNISAKSSSIRVSSIKIRAEKSEESAVSRRAALSLIAAAAAITLKPNSAEAAYGEAANVFGATKKQTGFIPFKGDGFELDIPSKWNPSKEIEFPGTVLRFEDNFDATNNLSVIIQPSGKKSIADYGSPEDFLSEVSYLLGKQSYSGFTGSEGGFEKNAVSTASLLDKEAKVIDGKLYYKLSLLTRTADGDEGGKHQLITGAVSDGKLYMLKIQAGDKRWFKGAKKFVEGAEASFSVV